MISVTDQIGEHITLREIPKRIVSLVPSQTELIYELGCGSQIVGQTLFCIHPKEKFKNATKIGGTKTPKIDQIIASQPDLIIANKEENRLEDISILEKHAPVWVSDVNDLPSALEMIKSIGILVGAREKAMKITTNIESGFKTLTHSNYGTALYLIWKNPYMTVGGDTFIHDMICRAGFKNIYGNVKRYPEISEEEIIKVKPNVILLSSEPFPFKEKHIKELQALVPDTKILLVDGEMFSWYGSKLLQSCNYFTTIQDQIKNCE